MRKSWSISESPWNSAFLVASSAKMVPILQTSTGVEYREAPSNTSGALYHRVTTYKQKHTSTLQLNLDLNNELMSYTGSLESHLDGHIPHVCRLGRAPQKHVPSQNQPVLSHLCYQLAGSVASGHDAELDDSDRTESPPESDTNNSAKQRIYLQRYSYVDKTNKVYFS